jgi:hypothetical protein
MARPRTTVAEQEVNVPEGTHAIAVVAGDHNWIALAQGPRELVVEQSGTSQTSFVVTDRGTYTVRTDGRLARVDVEPLELPPLVGADAELLNLRLTSDAPDRHVLDGVSEIAADGESSCTITIEKLDATGEPLTRGRDNDELFLRSTGGTIEDAKKDKRIRSIKLKSGRASFRLVSEPTPRLVTVSAIGAGSSAPAELQIEFV